MKLRPRIPRALLAAIPAAILGAGLLLIGSPARAQTTVFINEIHYDNAGADTGEAVEVAGPPGADLTGWSLALYNGNGGAVYDTIALSGVIPGPGTNCGVLAFPAVGLQNGSPDGLALVDATDTVVQFLSYEGSFTAAGGPADGMTSTDIGVSESGSDPLDQSLQLGGTGSDYEDFTWNASAAETFGKPNAGQTFSPACEGGPTPTPTSTPPSPPPAEVVINEVRIDQPGTDNDEYFELAGSPGASLDGLTYLVIGDGTGGSGVIENVTDLTGQTIPASGFFVAAESTFTLGTADFTTGLNFENGDNVTHLLVAGFTGANGDDLDTNDDGVLDSTPWTSQVDLIALILEPNPPSTTEYHYGPPTVGPDGSFVPGHAYRCAEGFRVGAFDPVGGNDTPGAANVCAPFVPDVVINEIRIDQPGDDNDEYFELAGSPGTPLDGLTYLVIGDGSASLGSGVIENVTDLTGQSIPSSGYFVAAESTFTLGTADFTTNLNFENSDNVTHLLVAGFSGANGDDLDTDDDGVLDSTPWTDLLDLIALVEEENPPTGTEFHYGPPSVGPDGTFVPGHVYRCSEGFRIGAFDPVGGADTPGAANNCETLPPFGVCGDPAVKIYDVQGAGDSSPLLATNVVLEGVVVGDFQDTVSQLGGFFLQEEDAQSDADPATSDGIFVSDSGFGVDVASGDVVRVQGEVAESFGLTTLAGIDNVAVCPAGDAASAATLTLPVAAVSGFEAYEGMLVHIPQTLYASDNFNWGRFGEVALSVGSRLFIPTHLAEPGAPANALEDLNLRSQIQLDDGSNVQNPLPLPPYVGTDNTLRDGDTVPDLTGVLSYSFGAYEIHPTGPVVFTRVNDRPAEPQEVGGRMKVASFNVLNFFTTIDNGIPICGPAMDQDCRGADTTEEFDRQRAKILEALQTIDADVVGLIELENNASESLQNLVDGLNDALGPGTYAFVDTGTIGTDAIKLGLIYKPASVAPIGAFQILDSSDDPRFLDMKNRPALAQTFEENASGERFTVVVNHLKSKGSDCNDVGDPDVGDGQGNCNLTRTAAAEALVDWLATDPTGSGDPDFLVTGDLNSYAKEDPIDALKAGGYTNLIEAAFGDAAYSYVFFGEAGYLDHALSTPTLTDQVAGVTEWHINADEPSALDYNNYNQPALFNPDPYRASDHDPVVVGLDLIPQCNGLNATIYVGLDGVIVGGPFDGEPFKGYLRGTHGDDVIVGSPNSDLIQGRGGHDTVCAGDGNDVILALGGSLTAFGEGGNDLLTGGFSDDVLDGGAGNDLLLGLFGNDDLNGGAGKDILNGGKNDDVCDGGVDGDKDIAIQCEVKIHIP